jgi:hypothetical protein
MQNPERLALDFTGARLKIQKTSIPGVSAPVRGVRMGQFRPDVARIVIDLTASVPYQIAREGDAIVVYLPVRSSDANAAATMASTTSEKSAEQIAAATTLATKSAGTSNQSSNAATTNFPLSNELTHPSVTSAVTNATDQPQPSENGGDFSRNPTKKIPTGVILVKGAWSSASDSVTPVPEGGSVNNNAYNNAYFGLRYTLAPYWTQKYSGPPPSDSGYYVLAQIRPEQTSEQAARGSILITAQDLFFTLPSSTNAVKLIQDINDNLDPDYRVELPPTVVQLANHSFVRFDYGSPVADMHWHVLAIQIRCHALEFIFTSRDTKLAESLIRGMNMIELPGAASTTGETGENNIPVCIRDYTSGENVIQKVEPVITEHRFNSVPVRIIIDKEGKVKHIHFLSAFPDQTRAITNALIQWRFRPYLRGGRPVEVETGIMFGQPPRPAIPLEINALSE